MDLNDLHVPDDAGEYRDALIGMMKRIPDGWGRWISCDRGWYPLITTLDRDLAAIDPGYELHQCKEKFGGLRYYIGIESENKDETRYLIDEAEKLSFMTCENCGNPGHLHQRRHWMKTLCERCAERLSTDEWRFVPVEE